jgi:hypothetical protein
MGDIVNFPTLLDDPELIEDLARFSEGALNQDAVKKRHRLPDNVWQQLGENDALVEKVENRKLQRIRSGQAKREKSQMLVTKAPDVLSGIMLDPAASPKHRIDSAKVLDQFSATGPEAAPTADRFIISIHLGADVEHYNKSRAIDANDPDDINGTTPNVVATITAKKPQDDDNGGEHI